MQQQNKNNTEEKKDLKTGKNIAICNTENAGGIFTKLMDFIMTLTLSRAP